MSELEKGFNETVTSQAGVVQGTVLAKRAVIYLRVSTAEQAHGDGASEGYSIPAQRDACTRKAHDLGAEVVAEFVDRGESARSAARPGLQLMLGRLAEHKDVDYVIVHKIDRLARNRPTTCKFSSASNGLERGSSQSARASTTLRPASWCATSWPTSPSSTAPTWLRRFSRARPRRPVWAGPRLGLHLDTSTCGTSPRAGRYARSRLTRSGLRLSDAR